jgi:group I intron endonuclease
MFGKKHTPETLAKMSDALKGQAKPEGAGKPSLQIEVVDLQEKTITTYDSFSEAVRVLNLPRHTIISNYIKNNQQKPYKARYIFKKIQG